MTKTVPILWSYIGTLLAILLIGKETSMRKVILLLIINLLIVSFAFAQNPQTVSKPAKPQFLDLDGDGFNDLAPDIDSDGIPDCIDSDFVPGENPLGISRWHHNWFVAMPDSVSSDSTHFREWWENGDRNMEWTKAWQALQTMENRFGNSDCSPGWNRDGFTPRQSRFIYDPRRSGSGRGPSGGGNGGGNGGGSGGGNGNGNGGGGGNGNGGGGGGRP